MTMTTDDLIAMERAATKGPWIWYNAWGPGKDGLMRALYLGHEGERVLGDSMMEGDVAAKHEDLALIARSRSVLPELLALAKAVACIDAKVASGCGAGTTLDLSPLRNAHAAYLAKLATLGEA